jgi:hypothetical protein
MKRISLLILFLTPSVFLTLLAQNGGSCRRAIPLTPGVYEIDSFIAGGATYSGIFPFPTKAKWYKYTPTADGLMTISSCGGGSDSRLFLYTGSCDTLVQAGFNDDFCPIDAGGEDLAAAISKPVKANKTYFFEWDNAWDTTRFEFILTFTAFTARATQTCATATTIAPGTIRVDSLFGFATRGDASRANWYKFTPTRNGRLTIAACAQDVDSRLWVYRGICNTLVPVADSDDDCTDEIGAEVLNLNVSANITYYFEWDDTWENTPFSFLLIFDNTSATDDKLLSQAIQTSPNPAQNFLKIEVNLDMPMPLNVQVLNLIGQPVFTKILKGSENLNLSHLESGVYVLLFSDGKNITQKKLVIQR